MGWLMGLVGAGCCMALGLQQAGRAEKRGDDMESWERAMLKMAGAIEAGGRGLPEILEASEIPQLQAGAQLLRQQPALSPEQWAEHLPRDEWLKPAEWALLRQGLMGLFAPLPAQQLREMAYARKRFTPLSAQAREEAGRRGKLYRALGWLGGAAVFILIC